LFDGLERHANCKALNAMLERRVLVVDDEQETCDLLKMVLEREGYTVATSTSAQAALELVGARDFDVVLTDLSMPEMGGLELCERVVGTRPNVPVVVITGQGSLETAIGAIRVGAYDFITKPVDPKLLTVSAARAMQHKDLSDEVKRLRTEATLEQAPMPSVVGSSSTMRRVFALVTRVADSEAGVLIHGETGTGKELIAKAIHDRGRRKEGPFVAINCAAVPATLIESELFGHERGAFTDAKTQRTGLFVQASGGTLFLDEIGELPLEVQPKLLRALQERKVRPVGSNREIPFDSRIIAATNRVLEDEVYEKRFREDLFYRINVVKLDVPPLRERSGDVLHLARHFLKIYADRHAKGDMDISPAAAEKLISYSWPGNVRELENCLDGAVALARNNRIEIDDLPEKVRSFRPEKFVVSANQPEEIVSIDELERRYILRVLSLVGGNKSRAAQVLGFDRRTLYRKLERYQNGNGGSVVEPAAARL
jgi:two-component system, NtrC family, response regulator HydG